MNWPAAVLIACRAGSLLCLLPVRGFWIGRLFVVTLLVLLLGPLAGPADLAVGTVVRESAVGIILGLCVTLPLIAARSAGLVLGTAVRGGRDRGVLGRLYLYLALTLFLSLSGPEIVLAGLARSYELLPVGSASESAALDTALGTSAQFFLLALLIAAPPLASFLLAEIAVLLAHRGWRAAPARSLLFLLVLFLSNTAVVATLDARLGALPGQLAESLQGLVRKK